MPVVNFHLIEGMTTQDQNEKLLREAAILYSDVLKSPMERIRAFITTHKPEQFLVAGELVSSNNLLTPYFDFIVLEGRPIEERHRLLEGFTDLLVEVLDVKKESIRGSCRRILPEDWAIGGVPASELRKKEIESRAEVAKKK